MIDIENLVYTNIRNAIKAYNSAIDVQGIHVDVPSTFPHVSIVETDNSADASTISTSDREYSAELTYTVNIYTNTANAKTVARAIANVVNDAFTGIGFVRSMMQVAPNIDRTIYRLILRYQATAWKAYDGADGHYNITSR